MSYAAVLRGTVANSEFSSALAGSSDAPMVQCVALSGAQVVEVPFVLDNLADSQLRPSLVLESVDVRTSMMVPRGKAFIFPSVGRIELEFERQRSRPFTMPYTKSAEHRTPFKVLFVTPVMGSLRGTLRVHLPKGLFAVTPSAGVDAPLLYSLSDGVHCDTPFFFEFAVGFTFR